jgi:hypothetical protein
MIVTNIKFIIRTEYLKARFDTLKRIGTFFPHLQLPGIYEWTFPMSAIEDVEKILAEPIEFDSIFLERILQRTPLPREEVDMPGFKGKSGFIVDESQLPKCYVVIEWRKVEKKDGIEVEQLKHMVTSENVKVMRAAIEGIDDAQYDDAKIPGAVIANKVIEAIGITAFHENGVFDWGKFFGNRTEYFNYYYYPLKVLAYKKEIIHHKNGMISKIKRIQTTLDSGVYTH